MTNVSNTLLSTFIAVLEGAVQLTLWLSVFPSEPATEHDPDCVPSSPNLTT
jgi:hypothetical protein